MINNSIKGIKASSFSINNYVFYGNCLYMLISDKNEIIDLFLLAIDSPETKAANECSFYAKSLRSTSSSSIR